MYIIPFKIYYFNYVNWYIYLGNHIKELRVKTSQQIKFSDIESKKSRWNDVKCNVRITIQSINLGKVIDIKRFSRNIRLVSARGHYVRKKKKKKIGTTGRTKRRNNQSSVSFSVISNAAITKVSKSSPLFSRLVLHAIFVLFRVSR